tara:strand:+ start:2655 stop:2888 length:234 start_codon:yes stop_codon:yes gene_type:complete
MNNEQEVAEALNAINDCLIALGKRLQEVEEYVATMNIAEKVLYKPNGQEKYLNIKENYDLIYQRLDKLEKERPWDVK